MKIWCFLGVHDWEVIDTFNLIDPEKFGETPFGTRVLLQCKRCGTVVKKDLC